MARVIARECKCPTSSKTWGELGFRAQCPGRFGKRGQEGGSGSGSGSFSFFQMPWLFELHEGNSGSSRNRVPAAGFFSLGRFFAARRSGSLSKQAGFLFLTTLSSDSLICMRGVASAGASSFSRPREGAKEDEAAPPHKVGTNHAGLNLILRAAFRAKSRKVGLKIINWPERCHSGRRRLPWGGELEYGIRD